MTAELLPCRLVIIYSVLIAKQTVAILSTAEVVKVYRSQIGVSLPFVNFMVTKSKELRKKKKSWNDRYKWSLELPKGSIVMQNVDFFSLWSSQEKSSSLALYILKEQYSLLILLFNDLLVDFNVFQPLK